MIGLALGPAVEWRRRRAEMSEANRKMKTREISDKALQTLIGMSPEPVYSVLTYDMPSERYTPQDGLPAICARSELRSVLRALRKDGYEACKGDSAVLIERIEFTEIASYIQRHNPS